MYGQILFIDRMVIPIIITVFKEECYLLSHCMRGSTNSSNLWYIALDIMSNFILF